MASIVETKAVALRRGSHSENLAFTGVQGEVTVDLGEKNLGTDVNTTLRLHNGTTTGGIPMARADMLNVSTQVLAENRAIVDDKNLAYADLSNIEVTNNTTEKEKIVSILGSYGLATKSELSNKVDIDTGNLNTKYLTEETIHDGIDGNLPLAYANTSNINTADLVDGSLHPYSSTNGNKPLGYADLSNVNTTNITLSEAERTAEDVQVTGPVIAKADFSNTNTTLLADTLNRPQGMSGPVLATADLSNVDTSVIETIVESDPLLEKTTNKDTSIDEFYIIEEHYPETNAVVNYVRSKLTDLDENYATVNLINVHDWDMLYKPSSEIIYFQNVDVISSDSGFYENNMYPTGVYLTKDSKEILQVEVLSVDSSGSITDMEIYKKIGTVDLTNENPFVITSETDNNATFTIVSIDNHDGTYTYSVGNILDGGSGFNEDESSISESIYNVKSHITDENYYVICQELYIIPTVVSDGEIQEAMCYPQYTLTDINQTITINADLTNIDTATLNIQSNVYSTPAGVAKIDLTNLSGMSLEDQQIENNSHWRIRHNENFPSLTAPDIDPQQNYTISTNGNLWKVLKGIYNSPNVILQTQFVSDSSHTLDSSTVVLFDENETNLIIEKYAKNNISDYTQYLVYPEHNYYVSITNNGYTDNRFITTKEPGTKFTFNYSLAEITFNTNVNNSNLRITNTIDDTYRDFNIQGTTITTLVTTNATWSISKSGYITETGSIDVSLGNQSINVNLNPE